MIFFSVHCVQISKKSDVFALGVMLHTFVHRQFAFRSLSSGEMLSEYRKRLYEEKLDEIMAAASDRESERLRESELRDFNTLTEAYRVGD
jgi:hypothetical protein